MGTRAFGLFVTSIILINWSCVCTHKIATNVPDRIELVLDSTNNATTYEKIFTVDKFYNKAEIKITDKFSFFIIQVHSLLRPVKLSNTSNFDSNTYVNGHSIGIVQTNQDFLSYNVFLQNDIHNDAVLILVNVYEATDSIPGGTLISDNKLSSHQIVDYSDAMIEVRAQAASSPDQICSYNSVKLEMYRMYLNSWDFSKLAFFSSIQNMSTIDGIRLYGTKVSEHVGYLPLRQFYSNYRVGSVYGIIATYNNYSSAYVPVVSYGCNILNGFDSCYWSFEWVVLGVLLTLAGFMVIIVDFHWPGLTTFFVVFFVGLACLYIPNEFFLSLALLVIPSIAAAKLAVKYKKTKSINSLFAGYLLAAMTFFSYFVGDLELMQNDVTYWAAFLSTTILYSILVSRYYRLIYSILFAIGISMLYYGVLYYAILNNLRRISVKNFELAMIDPPFQTIDYVAVILGFKLFLLGCFFEFQYNRLIVDVGERKPLLG